MREIEEKIIDEVYEAGLSSKVQGLLKENVTELSSEFLTDILAENANLHADYNLLAEFLPHIWSDNKNASDNLLYYISGLAHPLFYLAREYPLGKEEPQHQIEKINNIHKQLCIFMDSCLEESFEPVEVSISEIESLSDLIPILSTFSKYSTKITDIFFIMASLFYSFALNENQQLRNIDELALFLSRCLIFSKLGVLSDEKLLVCLEKSIEKFEGTLKIEKFEKILSLEIQNYQFLQIGISKQQIKLVASLLNKMLV
ncbi:MAG: hypothetical protein ACXABK_00950 [Candidatus Heimdallarchaeaceae archaeon]